MFEKFVKITAVTLYKYKNRVLAYINKNASEKFEIWVGDRIDLYFDRETMMAGIKIAPGNGRYKTYGSKSKRDVRFYIDNFLKYYNLVFRNTQQYRADIIDNMLVFGPLKAEAGGKVAEPD